jgi:phosphoglycolate phosphatase-like HAD superfamily hydrolase
MVGVIFDLDQTIIDTQIAEPDRAKRNWFAVYQLIPRFTLYPGILDALAWIQEREIAICIVTSSPEIYCKKVLQYWNIPYHHTVCYHDTTNKKPHPEPMLKALERMRMQSVGSISFGDRDIDIISSNGAGIKSVACLWGALDTTTLLQARPTFAAAEPHDIIKIIRQTDSSGQKLL